MPRHGGQSFHARDREALTHKTCPRVSPCRHRPTRHSAYAVVSRPSGAAEAGTQARSARSLGSTVANLMVTASSQSPRRRLPHSKAFGRNTRRHGEELPSSQRRKKSRSCRDTPALPAAATSPRHLSLGTTFRRGATMGGVHRSGRADASSVIASSSRFSVEQDEVRLRRLRRDARLQAKTCMTRRTGATCVAARLSSAMNPRVDEAACRAQGRNAVLEGELTPEKTAPASNGRPSRSRACGGWVCPYADHGASSVLHLRSAAVTTVRPGRSAPGFHLRRLGRAFCDRFRP